MQENGLADAQGAASVSVVPSTTTAVTPPLRRAVGRLLEAGALERDEKIDPPHANISGETEAFRITAGGIDLLQKSE